ncbi:excisionase [Streptococcus equi]|uniref:excisionase n=1 Tax=Streptococcus equi TaxID=1336 RepID=UPI0013DC431A|nr:excisionase [Streptococcus equi]
MGNVTIPPWEKYTLSIREAAQYFRIGETKLRALAEQTPPPEWVMMNGNRIQIKRKQFEAFIDKLESI